MDEEQSTERSGNEGGTKQPNARLKRERMLASRREQHTLADWSDLPGKVKRLQQTALEQQGKIEAIDVVLDSLKEKLGELAYELEQFLEGREVETEFDTDK